MKRPNRILSIALSFMISLLTVLFSQITIFAQDSEILSQSNKYDTESSSLNEEENSVSLDQKLDKELSETTILSDNLSIDSRIIEKSFKQYLFKNGKNTILGSETTNITMQDIDNYVEYAANHNIIPNTPQAKASLSKAALRTLFKNLAKAGKNAGYKTAAKLLAHACQDSPSNLSFISTSDEANQIAKSVECKKIVADFKKAVSGKNLSRKYISGSSTTLKSTTDLHLAYNKVSYTASGKKDQKTGKWTLQLTFKDKYDFEMQAWKNAMSNNPAVTAVNNLAAVAQEKKALVPYSVKVTVKVKFKE